MKLYSMAASLAALAVTFTAAAAQAASYTLDTSAIFGQTGSLYFQFNPDTTGIPVDATVAVSGLTNSTAAFTLDNSSFINDHSVTPYTFGNTLTVTADFATTATPGADSGNTLLLSLLDGSQNAYGTTDATDLPPAVLSVHQDVNGGLTSTIYPLTAQAVPETGTFASCGLLLLGLGGVMLRTRHRPA